MKHCKSLFVLHCLQLAHQTKTWVGPILFACLAAFYVFRNESSLAGFLSSPGSILVLTFYPLVVSAGAVSDDVRTGRVLWLHTFGVGRAEYIIFKILSATLLETLAMSLPILAFFAYLGLTGHGSSWRLLLLVQVSIFVYFLYWSSFLVFLSTFLRSWANSAFAYGLQLVFPFIVVPLISNMSAGAQAIRYFGTVCYGPVFSISRLARGQLYPRTELIVASLALGLFIVGAVYIYSRTAFGETLRKEG
jgi:ABC-type transport system involved in multi-copper enzyme maturation permease subunit